jgi:hypothetical protein
MDFEFSLNGVRVTVTDGPYLADGRPTARGVAEYSRLIEQLDSLRGFAADKLLSLYNDTWCDEEIGTVDRAGFVQRLSDSAVCLNDELGAATVYFGDGGMFAGHWIEVTVEDGEPVDAGIIG